MLVPMHIRTISALVWPAVALLLASTPAINATPWVWTQLHPFKRGSVFHAEATARLARSPDLVVVGSSVAHIDVREEEIDDALGATSVNLGIDGADLRTTTMQLHDLLRLDPQVVLLVLEPRSLFVDPDRGEPRLYDARVAPYLYDLGDLLTDRTFHLQGALGTVSAMYRLRNAPRRRLTGRTFGREIDPRDLPPLRPEGKARTISRVHTNFEIVRTGKRSDADADALCFLARALREADVDLLVAMAPVHPAVLADPSHPKRVLAELADRCAFEIIETDIPFEDSEFRDATHLLVPGQHRFTATLTPSIDARLD